MKSSGEFKAEEARARLKGKVRFDATHTVRYPFKPFDVRLAYLDSAIQPLFSRPSPALLALRKIPQNTFLITRDTADKDPEGTPFLFSRLVCDYDCISGHSRHFPSRVLPTSVSGRVNGQTSFLAIVSSAIANLSSTARAYLAALPVTDPDAETGMCQAE